MFHKGTVISAGDCQKFQSYQGLPVNSPAMRSLLALSLLLVIHSAALAAAQGSGNTTSPWQTLTGDAPLVIARGGFSGLFPDSSSAAYTFAIQTGLPDTILWCDVQITKDGVGVCFPDLKFDNFSDIRLFYPNVTSTYTVNGVPTQGRFTIDFTLNDLANVTLTQGVLSRAPNFDGNLYQILLVEDVFHQFKPTGYWLNIEHDAFFTQHNFSMRSYVISVSRSVIVNYISSPEVNFLRSIYARFKPSTTKLVFRFRQPNDVEPSTNQTYGSLLSNLTFVKTFASGILVPKNYIWPVDGSLYLQPHTSVVSDAHKEGLQVFASDFANDLMFSYNYSYDPLAEVLSFVDNGDFSVDGVISDFPITASAAIGCFSHIGKNESGPASPLVISYNGASGDYPGCTDLAYTKAISDGVDVLDCSVQMTKDGIPICLGSINLIDSTAAAESPFSDRAIIIPEIQSGSGIFTFNLTWEEIQTLKPVISSEFKGYRLQRNPKFRNSGTFLTLPDFLGLTKNTSSLSGVLISIENAAYLAQKQSMSVTDVVLDALDKAGFDNQTATKVMIQSTNSSVLKEFKAKKNYELVYLVDELIRDALNSTVEDIKSFADSVVIKKSSIFPDSDSFITGVTDVVTKLHEFKLPVYVQRFSNEFVSQAWDFFSDATVEINSYVMGAGIDGVITDYPKTSVSYKKNLCLTMGNDLPSYMQPVQPGGLMQAISAPSLPPAEAPFPVLTDADVIEPPLPEVSAGTPPATGGGSTAPAPTPPNGQPQIAACIFLSTVATLLSISLLFSNFS